MNKIFRFNEYLKPVIWGGDKIAALKGLKCDRDDIGESWEISGVPGHLSCVAEGEDKGRDISQLIDKYGARLVGRKVLDKHGNAFPLLIKFIDSRQDLSVQVHPDDTLAKARHNCPGKTEMWYIIDSEPGAKIYSGLAKAITPEEYTRRVADKTIMEAVQSHCPLPGDVFFLPAGRIHAIGAGNLLLEIQQTSDITYRIYDYDRRDANGNPRELHTHLAKDAIDYHVYPSYRQDYDHDDEQVTLSECEYFTVKRYHVHGNVEIAPAPDSFISLTCIEGHCSVQVDDESVLLPPFHTILIAAEAAKISASGKATIITASL